MHKDIKLRIALDVILGIFIILGWWYVALPIAIVGAWVFPRFAELIVLAVLHDALYGMSNEFGIWGWMYSFVAVIVTVVIGYLKGLIK